MVCRTTHRTSDAQGDSSMCSKGRLPLSAQASSPQDQRERKFLPHPSLARCWPPAPSQQASSWVRVKQRLPSVRRLLSDVGTYKYKMSPEVSQHLQTPDSIRVSHARLVAGEFTRVMVTVHMSHVRCFLLCWPQGLSSRATEDDGSQFLASAMVLSHTRGEITAISFCG